MIGGPITALALSSVHTFVSNILPCHLPVSRNVSILDFSDSSLATPLQIALSAITTALARCRFPSSTPAQDELVLLRLLKVTDCLVTGPLESELADEGVCEMLEVGLGMGGRARLGGKLDSARIVNLRCYSFGTTVLTSLSNFCVQHKFQRVCGKQLNPQYSPSYNPHS